MRKAPGMLLFACSLSLFRLCIFALQVGERHVERFVTEPDANRVYARSLDVISG
jgi:hypothetical protein